jgi:hypothetical protein
MGSVWSSFLSCDAREMCRISPALMRNHLGVLAVLFRLGTLWAALSTAFCHRVGIDLYWGSRQGGRDYSAFMTLVDEAHHVRDALLRHEVLDHESSRQLANRMQWLDEQMEDFVGFFPRPEKYQSSDNPCSGFLILGGRLHVLKSEEADADGFLCGYSEFAF